ncbi:hypothetical protein A2U01_0116428, partial [Trifolium medium]|nr:hypothetical protein [Trifolium medium]
CEVVWSRVEMSRAESNSSELDSTR